MAARHDHFMPLYIGAYLTDTLHLTRDQHGAYFLLLLAYWKLGGPLPDDDARLATIAKATLPEWKRLRPVIAEFFVVANSEWRQKRADIELERAHKQIQAKVDGGTKGAARRWGEKNKVNADGTPNGIPNGTAMAETSVSQWDDYAPLPTHKNSKKEESKKVTPSRCDVAVPQKPKRIEIPYFVPTEPLSAFIAMRKKLRRPMTDRALDLLFKELAKLHNEGEDVGAILDQSTMNGWLSVRSVKQKGNDHAYRSKGGASNAHQNFLKGCAKYVGAADQHAEDAEQSGRLALAAPCDGVGS